MSDEQIAAVADCLNRHGVDYVLIGGGAALLHGAPIARTRDADIVPAKRADNLDRLAAALREMDAKLWVGLSEPEGLEMVFAGAPSARLTPSSTWSPATGPSMSPIGPKAPTGMTISRDQS